MRLSGGHENHLAVLQAVGLAGDDDLDLALQHLYQRIERGCVFAQAFAFVESEDRHRAGGLLDNFAPYDGAVLVVDECNGFRHLGHGERFRF